MKKKSSLLIIFIFVNILLFGKNDEDSFNIEKKYKTYVFFSTTCPICIYYSKTINEFAEKYKSVEFVYVYTGGYSKKQIKEFNRTYSINISFINDCKQKLLNKLKGTTTPEVFLVEGDSILYSGLIDDSFFDIGRRKSANITYYLQDAIEEVLSNQPIKIKKTIPVGCLINIKN